MQTQGRVLNLEQGHDTGDLELCQDHGRDNIWHLELYRAARLVPDVPWRERGQCSSCP